MKKLITSLTLACLLCVPALAMLPAAEAAGPAIYYNGDRLYPDVDPFITRNGVMMVEMRSIFETFGATLNFDKATKIITAIDPRGNKVEMKVGYKDVYVNNEQQWLSEPVQIWYGRTMVPLRFMAENLDGTVKWDPDNYWVEIWMN